MRTMLAGRLVVHATGGSDRDGGGDGPTVVLCHGFGAPGDDLVSLARVIEVAPHTRWFFPEAPHAIDVGMGMVGRAWWHIDMMKLQMALARGEIRDLASETPDGLDAAADALTSCLDSLVNDHGVDPARMVLGGFSQGAMLTTELTLCRGTAHAGLAVLSGTLLSEARWRAGAAERARGLAVFQSHGRYDPILPYPGAEELRDILTASGADVSFVPFSGQHEIPPPALDGLQRFARARLA